jgi:HlyD family secretion protein
MRVPDQALRYIPAGAAAAPTQVAGRAARQGQVWVLADGKPVRVAVTLGLDDDSFTEIVGGDVKPGDRVILSEQSGGTGKSTRPAVTPPRL